MLIEEETQYLREAKARFIAGLWAGEGSEKLLSLMAEAKLTVAVADELLEKVDQARGQIEQVNRLPRLRKEANVAQDRLNKAQSRLEAEMARLEGQVQDASIAASTARQAVYAADESARQLLALHDQGLVPASRLPHELSHLMERRQAEEVAQKAGEVRSVALREVDRCKLVVGRLEARRANLPLSITGQRDESRLERALKAARAELAHVEDRLKSAQAAADAAVKAIPKAR